MGITDTSERITHSGNGTTTLFPFNFRVFETDQVKVIVRTDSTGAESVKTLTTDYSVTLNAGEGGSVTMNVAPILGETLCILKDVPETQPEAITVGNLPAATLEQMYDRLTMLIHQVRGITRRVPLLKASSPSLDKTMAEPTDTYLLGWDSSGNIVNYAPSVLGTGTTVLDEDDMVSNSATAVPTQQSVKAYVDNNIATLTSSVSSITADPAPASLTVDTYLCDTSGGAFTVTLPAASGNTGKRYTFKYTDSGFANALTIDGSGAETIDGNTTTTLNTEGEVLVIECDGTGWQIIDRRIPSIRQTYNGTYSGIGTGAADDTLYFDREGRYIVINATIKVTTTWTGTQVGIPLPSGISADFSVMPNDTSIRPPAGGSAQVYDPSVTGGYNPVNMHVFDTTIDEIRLLKHGTGSFYSGTDLVVNDEIMLVGVKIPVSGWNS